MPVAALVVLCIVFVLVVLVVVLLINTLRLKPRPVQQPAWAKTMPEDGARADADVLIDRFQQLLRLPTIWGMDAEARDTQVFDDFLATLQRLYPTVFAELELTRVNGYGIVLHWAGTDATKGPVVLMAHHDVVEADPTGWTHPPFAAEIADGHIYARGTLDTKCIIVALFEATATLLAEGYKPPRDIYICSSNCEETQGETTPAMIDFLRERDALPVFVLDEGGAIIDSPPLGLRGEFALVGVAEKGIATAHITVSSPGGHAANPAPSDAPAKLVHGLEQALKSSVPAKLSPPIEAMLKGLASHAGFGLRLVFANLWLLRPLVLKIMKGNPETAAMIRSTYALTMIDAGKAVNVIPHEAEATINIRIDPNESVQTVTGERLRAHFDDSLQLEILPDTEEPSPISPFDDGGMDFLRSIAAAVYPEAETIPYVQSSASDARHFGRICPHTYRCAFFLFRGDQRSRIHGQDEHIDVDSYLRGVDFYTELIRHLDDLQL